MDIIASSPNDVNQILPHRYPQFWELYIVGRNNDWNPDEIPMGKDAAQWKGEALTDQERNLVKRVLGLFVCGESLVSNNLFLNVFRFLNSGEARQYMTRQAFEEALHNHTVVYCCDSLNLDIEEVYEAYKGIESIKGIKKFLASNTSDLSTMSLDLSTPNDVRWYLLNLVVFYMICEGFLFYTAFVSMLALSRRDLMVGIGEQIDYTMRDEANHVEFGSELIRLIKKQMPEVWTDEFKADLNHLFEEAIDHAHAFADDMLSLGIVGLNRESMSNYIEFMSQRRMASIGLVPLNTAIKNPFPWVKSAVELEKQSNFFEAKPKTYQSAGALVDDF